MLKPIQQDLLTSIDELFDSKVLIDSTSLSFHFRYHPKYQSLLKNDRIVSLFSYKDKDWLKKCIKHNIAIISHVCDGKGQKGLFQMYQIPETFSTIISLFVHPFQPYIDKLQNLMDRSFEAGLLMAWKKFYFSEAKKYFKVQLNQVDSDEKDVLDFEAIAPFFLILVIGFSVALLTLFCEIFHHDFWSQLSKNYLKLLLQKAIRKLLKRKVQRKFRRKKCKRINKMISKT